MTNNYTYKNEWIWVVAVIAIAWLAVWPVLNDPRVCILDCPSFFSMAHTVRWYDLSSYLWQLHPARSAYGMMLYLFPIYVIPSVAVRFWVHTGLLLAVTHAVIFIVVSRVTGRRLTGLAAAVLSLCHISFVENYYTMFKGEPWMLAGMLGMTWLLWQAAHGSGVAEPSYKRMVRAALIMLSALAIYSIKETGAAYFPVYACGICLAAWGAAIGMTDMLKRTRFMTVCNVVALGVQVWLYIHLPVILGLGSEETYIMSTSNIAAGTMRIMRYLWLTSPYLAGTLVLTCWVWWRYVRGAGDGFLRQRLAWITYFALLCGASMAILIPWTAISPRYYLAGAVAGIVWTILACEAVWYLVVQRRACRANYAAMAVAVGTMALLFMHAGYSMLVNHASEGRVQQRFDAAFDDMFRYVARHVSQSGTVAFVQDPRQREAVQGIPTLVRLLYDRPDIVCIFPTQDHEYAHAELICVPFRMGNLNYFRLPASENAGWQFIQHNSTAEIPYVEAHRMSYTSAIYFATTRFGEPQYRSAWGLPEWWKLRRGTYEFGWRVYCRADDTNALAKRSVQRAPPDANMLKNASFEDELRGWRYWGAAQQQTNQIVVVTTGKARPSRRTVRIATRPQALAGIAQTVTLRSGEVYRLSALVRSLVTNASGIGFGARVALFLPPQPEQQLVWMSEYNNWWRRELIFTNAIDGTATVYAHMGFGGFGSTGEFAGIRLERVE